MFRLAVMAVIVFVSTSSAVAQIDFYLARYADQTGDIVFPRLTGEIGLKLTAITDGALIGGMATDLAGAASGAFGVVNDQADSQGFIEWRNLTGLHTGWPVSAGHVAPTYLPAQGMVPECPGWCGYLVNGIEFEITKPGGETVQGYVVLMPEPSTAALSLVSGLAVYVYRKRRLGKSSHYIATP